MSENNKPTPPPAATQGGKRISRDEALKISTQTMINAEKERIDTAIPEPELTQGGSARECARNILIMIHKWKKSLYEQGLNRNAIVADFEIIDKITDTLTAYAERVCADKQAEIVALEARVKSAREIIINLTANGVPSDAYMDYCVDSHRWLEECDDAV